MIPAMGWAIVAGCMLVTGPQCNGYLATGIVWGDPEGCKLEFDREQIPGTKCMQIEGIREPAADTLVPSTMDEVIRSLDSEVRYGDAKG